MVMATRRDAPFDCAMQVSGDGGAGWRTIRPVTKLPAGALTCYGLRVIFTVVNDGKLNHRLALIPLPADFPPIEEQFHGTVRQVVQQAVAIRNLEPPGKGQRTA